jgi:hypothetical protein
MFESIVEFSTHEDYFELKEDYPVPALANVPEWYKKLNHSLYNKTVKGCMPFLDSLTAGYILKMPQDFYLKHNTTIENELNEKHQNSFQMFGLHEMGNFSEAKGLNLNTGLDIHPIQQLEGSPLIEKNKNLPFYKILNPWKIKTPKGYSCLFVSPLNNSDDRFSIISGIVDTDTFPNEINFPIVINGDKYPFLETTIKKGTPYVQIIPFKREKWKMKTKPISQKKLTSLKVFWKLNLLDKYKNQFWKKKSWK